MPGGAVVNSFFLIFLIKICDLLIYKSEYFFNLSIKSAKPCY